MIEEPHNIPRNSLEMSEVNQHPDFVEPIPADVDFDLPVVAVQVLTLSAVPAQRVSGGELFFDHDFVHRSTRADVSNEA